MHPMCDRTCEDENDDHGKYVRVLGQHPRCVQGHMLPRELPNGLPNQLIKCGTPGPSYARGTCRETHHQMEEKATVNTAPVVDTCRTHRGSQPAGAGEQRTLRQPLYHVHSDFTAIHSPIKINGTKTQRIFITSEKFPITALKLSWISCGRT